MSHPTAQTLDLYVMGAIDDVDAIESHLELCSECRENVAAAAAFENELSGLAEQVTFCVACDQVQLDPSARCADCGSVAQAGGFVVDELLVKNAHGRLYLAHDANGGRVALKELAFVQTPSAQVLASFEREAQFLRALNHPRIPRFVASFSEGAGVQTRLYLAQEYIEGSSLQARLSDEWFDEEKIRSVAAQLLEILVYLQGLSPIVVHRDIKPANILQRDDGTLVLVDFGAAHDPAESVGVTFAGTFGYLPMEQLAGCVDETTDLFALGQSLKHLLTRREPWRLTEPDALDAANVSSELRGFLDKLTASERAERFQGAAAAMIALRDLESGKRVKNKRSRARKGHSRPGFLRRWGARAALVASGALFAAVVAEPGHSHDVDAELELLCSAYADRYLSLYESETKAASGGEVGFTGHSVWGLRSKCEERGAMTPAMLACVNQAETLVGVSECTKPTAAAPTAAAPTAAAPTAIAPLAADAGRVVVEEAAAAARARRR